MEHFGRKVEGIIFDVDGTLLDTMPVWHDAGARFLALKLKKAWEISFFQKPWRRGQNIL